MELNTEQKKAAEFNGKHLLVLAGAGTGKTKTIVARAEYLINSGVEPSKIALLSFTKKSAQEIAERIKITLPKNVKKNTISGKTFHSWCKEIMNTYYKVFPQSKYTILDPSDQISAMGIVIGKNFKDGQDNSLNAETIIKIYSYAVNTQCNLSAAISHIKSYDSNIPEEMIQKMVEDDKAIIAPVIKKYIEYKIERKYIDYDDMLNIVADNLEKNTNLRKSISERWTHILIDEMQDTNPLQYKLIKSFVDSSNLFCVGDDAQSIYGFRGADFKTIHSFDKIIPNSQTFKLTKNYRSTQEILDLSNWLLEQSPLKYDKKLVAFRGKGEKPKLIHTTDEWQEADLITADVLKSVNQDNSKYKDNLVLGRSGYSLQNVEAACILKDIPYIKLGGTKLMESAHVRDVFSAMRIVANNYDEISWMRFLKLWDGIGDVTASRMIEEILKFRSFEDITEYIDSTKHGKKNEELTKVLSIIKINSINPSKAIKEAVKSMEKILLKKYSDDWDKRVLDFDVLKEVAKSTGSISEFIAEYILDPIAETTKKMGKDIINDVVTLSTIHSAKGLEAKNVHIVGVNPHSYPSTREIKEGLDAVEEERRCLYVALTRAMDNLNVYRSIKSMQTEQPPQKTEIKNGNMYCLKTDNSKQVEVIKSIDNVVTFCCTTTKEVEELSVFDFQQKYKEMEIALYFLNNLPPGLVNIVVPKNNRVNYTNQNFGQAHFPDFDFD